MAGDYDALWRWSVDDLEAFWAAIWEFFEVAVRDAATSACSARARCRARSGSRARAELRRAHLPRPRRRRRGDPPRVASCASSASGRGASCARRPRAIAAGLRALGRRAGRPRRRLPAEHPRDDRGVPRVRVASARSGRRARRTSARAAWSTASRRSSRRCCSRSTATATAARTSTAATSSRGSQGEMPTLETTVVLPYLDARPDLGRLDGAMTWDELPRPARRPSSSSSSCRSTTRCGCSTRSGTTGLPKAIVHGQGGILLEHLKKLHLHLDAQAGRPRLLVHDDRLDDVELPRRRAADATASIVLYDGNPGHPDMGVLWDLAEQAGITCFGTSAALHRRVHEGGRRAGAGPRPERAAQRRLDRLAAVARGLPVGLRPARRATRGCSRPAAAPTSARRSSAACRRCRSTGASSRRRSLGANGRVVGRGRQAADRRGRRARDHRADAVDAGLLLGRRGRRRAARELLRHVPGRLAPRRLDRDHRARHGDHLRPLGLDDQPRRRAHGHERDLPRGARARRDRRRAGRRRAARGRPTSWMPLFVVLREGASSTTT